MLVPTCIHNGRCIIHGLLEHVRALNLLEHVRALNLNHVLPLHAANLNRALNLNTARLRKHDQEWLVAVWVWAIDANLRHDAVGFNLNTAKLKRVFNLNTAALGIVQDQEWLVAIWAIDDSLRHRAVGH